MMIVLGAPGAAQAADAGAAVQSQVAASLSGMPSSDLVITAQPAPLSVTAGAPASFTVAATGSGTLTYQWFKDGQWIDGADSATYALASASVSDAGIYTVVVRSGMARVTSDPAALSVADAGVVTAAPADQTVSAGSDATFGIVAAGTDLTYQWLRDGRPIQGATGASYTVSDAGVTAAGTYTVDVSGSSGLVAAESATLTVNEDARLSNLSIRGFVDGNSRTLVVGLAIAGTGQKQVLLRAVGPTLATFGVAEPLSNPVLTLFGPDSAVIASNAGWGGSTELSDVFAQVGAFALPAASADSALLQTLPVGTFTATITGGGGSSGIALAETYDADTGTPTADLTNLSARARVADGASALMAGFVITGSTSETILIRGVGPSLRGLFGFLDALFDTKIAVFDSSGAQVAANEGWGDDDDITAANSRVGAFQFMAHSLDSALLVTLAPGSYTVQLTGRSHGEAGTGMVEIYQVR